MIDSGAANRGALGLTFVLGLVDRWGYRSVIVGHRVRLAQIGRPLHPKGTE